MSNNGLDFSLELKDRVALKKARKDPVNIKMMQDILGMYVEYNQDNFVEAVKEKGYRTKKGNPYSYMGLRQKIWNFIVEYPEETREVYIQKENKFLHDKLGDQTWLVWIISAAAKHLPGKPEFIRWALNHGYYKSGFDIFKTHYNLTEEDRTAFDND